MKENLTPKAGERTHTPGLWAAGEIIEPAADGNRYEVRIYSPHAGRIAISTHKNKATADANARLIAASPDLLAALKDLVGDAECETCEKCEGSGINPRCKTDACHNCAGAGEVVRHPIWPQFLTNAIAAIQKAEGK